MKCLVIENYQALLRKLKRKSTSMVVYTAFMEWETQYGKDTISPQIDLVNQCNPNQNSNSILEKLTS